jgi:hypothetical protein
MIMAFQERNIILRKSVLQDKGLCTISLDKLEKYLDHDKGEIIDKIKKEIEEFTEKFTETFSKTTRFPNKEKQIKKLESLFISFWNNVKDMPVVIEDVLTCSYEDFIKLFKDHAKILLTKFYENIVKDNRIDCMDLISNKDKYFTLHGKLKSSIREFKKKFRTVESKDWVTRPINDEVIHLFIGYSIYRYLCLYSILSIYLQQKRTALMYAAFKGHKGMIHYLLKELKADVDKVDEVYKC